MRLPAHRTPISAHPSHTSWHHRELHPRPHGAWVGPPIYRVANRARGVPEEEEGGGGDAGDRLLKTRIQQHRLVGKYYPT
eukprot:6096084-Pyramimonas_sp.AAC.1